MANYQNLKAAIDQVIKTNGQKEITGPVLNDMLKAIVNSLGAGYQFMGVATPTANPGTPDQNVFYLAGKAGTYANFNSIVLPDGVSILKWNGSWSSETVLVGDGVFDISAYKATGGTLATFADLSAALDGGNNIPSALRKGGMSVKFVQSSDNKYVQYFLTKNEWSASEADWEKMNLEDEVSRLGQDVKSITGGSVDATTINNCRIYNGVAESFTGQMLRYVPLSSGKSIKLTISASQSEVAVRLGFFTSIPTIGSSCLDYVESARKNFEYTALQDGYFAYSIYEGFFLGDLFEIDSVLPQLQQDVQILNNGMSVLEENIQILNDEVGILQSIPMQSGYYLLGSLNVGDVYVEQIYPSESYKCGKVSCNEGEKFTLNLSSGSTAGNYIFVDSANKVIEKVTEYNFDNEIISAPIGAKFFYFNDNSGRTSYKGIENQIKAVKQMDNFGSFIEAFSLTQYNTKTLPQNYVRKGLRIECDILGSFENIRFGVGYNTYQGHWLEINATDVVIYKFIASAQEVARYAHNLDISQGCTISVIASTTTASIIIVDAFGGVSKQDNVQWWGGGSSFITNLGSTQITGRVTTFMGDITQKIWLFGDSYLSYNQNQRWLYYMLLWGFDKWLADHLPGENSISGKTDFDNVIKEGKPQFLLWCLGMNDANDPDSQTPDSTWLSVVMSVLSVCENKGVVPILSTIPTSKNDDGTLLKYHEGKNYWVRNSGYRYIDFAQAVGANGDGTWRTGLKASDIHPSELGAKVLASKVLVDFPEITLIDP